MKAEIAEALAQGKLVIPAPIEGTPMPARAALPPEIAELFQGPRGRGKPRRICFSALNWVLLYKPPCRLERIPERKVQVWPCSGFLESSRLQPAYVAGDLNAEVR